MKKSNKLVQFAVSLGQAVGQSRLQEASSSAPLLAKAIVGALPVLHTLKKKLDKAEPGELAAALKELDPDGDTDTLAELASLVVYALVTKIENQDNLALDIQSILFYILVLIGDFQKSKEFFNTKADFDLHNPETDFWFQRVDVSGTHEFNTPDGVYLINSIPAASSKKYYNSEIYNSPYTSQQPSNVIANPYPVDEITDAIELENFMYDLFINIPFASSQDLVFTAKIKVENVKGGSRGWGFWNTDAIPVAGMKTAWFMQQEGNVGKEYNGFFAHTFNGFNFSQIRLPDLDEEWHEYKIVLNKKRVEYFIDGKSVAKVMNSTGSEVPDAPMAFHNWVDNACFENEGIQVKKVFQKTGAPRRNYMEYMRITTKK